jgi:hypothetical protein
MFKPKIYTLTLVLNILKKQLNHLMYIFNPNFKLDIFTLFIQ